MNEGNIGFVIPSLKATRPDEEDSATPTLTKTLHRHFCLDVFNEILLFLSTIIQK
jgi:hypothetical protein